MNSNNKIHYAIKGLGRTYCNEGIYPTTVLKNRPSKKDTSETICPECLKVFAETEKLLDSVLGREPDLKWWEKKILLKFF